jgi:O-antigen/teichoic acid export membrane protein
VNKKSRDLSHRIFLHSAGFVSARAATGALSVIASLLLYRALGPEQAGRFQFVLAVGMTLGVVCGLGFHETLARFVPERSAAEGGGLFRRATQLTLLFGLLLGAVLFGTIRLLGVPEDMLAAGALLPAFVIVYGLYTCALGMLRGQGRLKILPVLDLGWNFGAKAAAVLIAFAIPTFVPAFAAYFGVDLLVVFLCVWLLRGSIRGPVGRVSKEDARFASMVLVAELLRTLCSTVDLYVVRGLLSAEATGLYTAGVRITTIVEQLVLSPIGVPLLYYFSRADSEELTRSIVVNGTRLLGGMMGAGALVLSAVARPLVDLLLGPQFQGSAVVAQIYTGHAVGSALLVLLIPLYNSRNQPQFAIHQVLLILALNLGLDLILVPRYGIAGAAAAGVASMVIAAVVFAWLTHSRYRVDIRSGVVRTLALYLCCHALLTVGWVIPALVLYGAGLWALRIVRYRDIELLRRRPAPERGE